MNRSRELFWELLEPEYLRAMMFCRKLTGDRERGDDLYQDALVIAYSRFPDLRDTAAFRPWLYRVLINRFNSTVRHSWWKQQAVETSWEELSPSGENPLQALTARRWLERAFRAVSPEERTLVTLYELEEWTVNELAELYGRSASAIKVRLFRARRKMRKALIDYSRRRARSETTNRALDKEGKCAVAKPGLD